MWPFQTRTVPDELTALRTERERVLTQRAAITERRCDRATAERRCAEALARAEAHGATLDVARFTRAVYDPRPFVTELLRFADRHLVARASERTLEALVVSLWPAEFREHTSAALDQLYADGDDGLTDAARATQLAACEADLLRLELAEERLIRDESRAGSPPERRIDSDPAVLLAPDAELAGPRRPTTIELGPLHAIEDAAAAIRAALFDSMPKADVATTAAQRAAERAAAGREHARRGGAPYMDEAALAALEAFAEDRARTRDRHRATVDALEAQWQRLVALATRCRAYTTARGIDLPPTIEPGAPFVAPVAIGDS